MSGLVSTDLPPGVQRILVWCALGCTLVRDAHGWRLERAPNMAGNHGPAPKPIQDRTAQAAIARGAHVSKPADLFGDAPTARAA